MDDRKRKSPKTLLRVLYLLGLAGGMVLTGCTHHVGYVDVRMQSRAVAGKARTVREQLPRLAVQEEPTAEHAGLGVQVARVTRIIMPVNREYSGREVYARYHWTVPLLKLALPISVPLAFILPARQPHQHDAGPWGPLDYWRDFLGWLNPFEAYPGGTQSLAADRVVFRHERAYETQRELAFGVAAQEVRLQRERNVLAVTISDVNGLAWFDLRAATASLAIDSDASLHVTCAAEPGALLDLAVMLPKEYLAAWRQQR